MLFFLPRKVRSRLAGKHITLLTLVDLWVTFLLVVFIAAAFLGNAEKISLKDALWQVWQTVTTVGYGDGPAKSDIGRFVTVIYSVAGIVLFGKLITVHSDFREELRHSRRYGTMKNPETNGFVILRYPGESNFLTLIAELRKSDPHVPICIVDPVIEELPPSTQYVGKLHFVRGSLVSRDTFSQAGIEHCRQVVIFPDPVQGSEGDATTRTVLELVENITAKRVPILFVLADTNNLWMFDGCKAKPIHSNVEVLLIAQECEDRGTAAAIQTMLSNLAGANPKTVTLSSQMLGLRWGDLTSRFPGCCDSLGMHASVLALVRNDIPNHLPDFDTKIAEGDQMILLTQGEFIWSKLESALASKAN